MSGKYVSEVSETDGIVSVSRLNVSEAPLNNFESVFDDPEYTYATANEEDKIEATDTINQAFNKIERIIIADELVYQLVLGKKHADLISFPIKLPSVCYKLLGEL